ncbi:hypothetical protein COW09_01855 [bacterium (Candidatus Moisslbacteria) CG12_big_fil_rev_8_21_14_0_65_36_11]|nr:MAG: hypothetical protein AUK09_00775 [Parcubacteria group bacterium CG2_30_36_38]PIV45923.1 MAG: hypothetical protein COS23_02005 [bacterium (Candidatus Moisslbacteria) CG02_land_8_20_14_3_00_36_53]PIW67717.1 MAG: hypothetical protein COW09_01855 [bacterium (Candidatus Moisslbacteria) CG12_big_fil_rev_8_21_14_0_65_36_11]PJC00653.1 MAG: hypothetical protein CO074_01220 [bacterium (Candidatus Moisslbacteria) CG_4_9_14_0_8_um_filter_36_20]
MEGEGEKDEYLVISWWTDPQNSTAVMPRVTAHKIKEEAGLEYAKRKEELKKYPGIIKLAKVIL